MKAASLAPCGLHPSSFVLRGYSIPILVVDASATFTPWPCT